MQLSLGEPVRRASYIDPPDRKTRGPQDDTRSNALETDNAVRPSFSLFSAKSSLRV